MSWNRVGRENKMEVLTCAEILNAVNGELLRGSSSTIFGNISTDSRKIESGDLFVPLVGQNFDGHDYIESSFEKGAWGCILSKYHENILNNIDNGKVLIKVDDTLKALREIATYYRSKFNIPFTGITGSVGKTSTKDMVSSVVSKKYNVLKTEGNFNNEIGVPLTVFRLSNSHEGAVLEMGMSGFGEISRLTSIIKPDIAIITNIGVSHIENLGSKNNILKAKMEILEGLSGSGLVILNGDDSLLYGVKDQINFRKVYYGLSDGLEYKAYNIVSKGEEGTEFSILLGEKEYYVFVPSPGIHNVYNALAAIATGMELQIPPQKIVEGIRDFVPSKMRLHITDHNGIKIINDAYNASPQSMEAAINVLCDIGKGKRTFAVLGDMLELGHISLDAHTQIGGYAAKIGCSFIVCVGENGRYIYQGALDNGVPQNRVFHFSDTKSASDFLKGILNTGDVVLVKGSRGMKMESIVSSISET